MSKTVFNSILAELGDPSCKGCKDLLDFDFTFAFQPIVDVQQQTIFAYEALVRGPNREGAAEILAKVNDN